MPMPSVEPENAHSIGDQPRVTVVLQCYSHEKYFEAALNSLLSQTAPLKITIHNNGAPESYAQKIRAAAERHGLHLVEERENTSGVAVRLKVLPFIDTEFFALLHDDDEYFPEKIEKSLSALDAAGADYVVTNHNYIDECGNAWMGEIFGVSRRPYDGKETRGRLLADVLAPECHYMHYSTMVMRTALAKKTTFGDPFWPRLQDTIFWGDLHLDESVRYHILPDYLTKVRIHGANDRFTQKFDLKWRQRQDILCAFSEAKYIDRILERASNEILLDFLNVRAGADLGKNLVGALVVMAVIVTQNYEVNWIPQQLMITMLIHKAWALDPLLTCVLLEQLTGMDANRFMTAHDDRFVEMLYRSCRDQ